MSFIFHCRCFLSSGWSLSQLSQGGGGRGDALDKSPVRRRATYTTVHTQGQFRVLNRRDVHVLGCGRNPHRHRENRTCQLHTGRSPAWKSNARPSRCEAAAIATAPPCRPRVQCVKSIQTTRGQSQRWSLEADVKGQKLSEERRKTMRQEERK